MSLRLAPSAAHATSTTNLTTRLPTTSHQSNTVPTAPSAPGLPDTLRSSLTSTTTPNLAPHSTPAPTISTHPLETRLAHWRSTQQALKMEGLRRTFGIAEPVRRGMELKIAREGEWRAMALGGSAGVSGDVLEGRDCVVEWEDVFTGNETIEATDFHTEMETRLKMNW